VTDWIGVDVSERTCTKCGEVKPATAEHFNKHRKGLRPECRECQKAYGRAYKAANKARIDAKNAAYRAARRALLSSKQAERYSLDRERFLAQHRANSLLRDYGLSVEDYVAILESQGGVCAYCQAEPGNKSLAVDHDHETGAVRGLLCGPCNTALGRFGDNVDGLLRALDYVRYGAGRVRHTIGSSLEVLT
jgi:hypothetical protein